MEYECPLNIKCKYSQINCQFRREITQDHYVCTDGRIFHSVTILGEGYHGHDFHHLRQEDFIGVVTRNLTLRNLDIRTWDVELFQYSSQVLVTLDLSHNHLQSLNSESFRNLTNLKSLDLSSNQLEATPADIVHWLHSLERLNLCGNRVSRIESGDFETVPSLVSLDVSYNPLKYIEVEGLVALKQLQHLDIHGTHLDCDCRLAWLRQFASCLCILSYDLCYLPTTYKKYSPVNFTLDGCPETEAVGCNASALRCENDSVKAFGATGFLETELSSFEDGFTGLFEDKVVGYARAADLDRPHRYLDTTENLPIAWKTEPPVIQSGNNWDIPDTDPVHNDRHQPHHHRSWFMDHAAFVFPIIAFVLILFITLCLWAFWGHRCSCRRLPFGTRGSCESFITETSHVMYSCAPVDVEQAEGRGRVLTTATK